uniref:WGS project CAEQ00000000 data, annotated contig 2168 n=1 Tax=Trypanosoma congolense (strain IL3000) TaxID=1068625 RepID=F9WC06_TRYCI|nr:unnamed protein product [Trypanosoma congolense IL3000]
MVREALISEWVDATEKEHEEATPMSYSLEPHTPEAVSPSAAIAHEENTLDPQDVAPCQGSIPNAINQHEKRLKSTGKNVPYHVMLAPPLARRQRELGDTATSTLYRTRLKDMKAVNGTSLPWFTASRRLNSLSTTMPEISSVRLSTRHSKHSLDVHLFSCITELHHRSQMSRYGTQTRCATVSPGARLFDFLACGTQRRLGKANKQHEYGKLPQGINQDECGRSVSIMRAAATISGVWARPWPKKPVAANRFLTPDLVSLPETKKEERKVAAAGVDAAGDEEEKCDKNSNDGNVLDQIRDVEAEDTERKNEVKKKLCYPRDVTRDRADTVGALQRRHNKVSDAVEARRKLRASIRREERKSRKLRKVAAQGNGDVDRLCFSKSGSQLDSAPVAEDHRKLSGFASNTHLVDKHSDLQREKATRKLLVASEAELVEKLRAKNNNTALGSVGGPISAASVRKKNCATRVQFHCQLVRRSVESLGERERNPIGKPRGVGKRISEILTDIAETKEVLPQCEETKCEKDPTKFEADGANSVDDDVLDRPSEIFHLTDMPH